jgi:dTDP-glucose pyrophosphorylase
MHIRRAVITAAGRDQQSLPLQRLVDRDGVAKTALEVIVEEAVAAGADQVGIVVRPGDEGPFRAAAGRAASRLELIPQPQPHGDGHAGSPGLVNFHSAKSAGWRLAAAPNTSRSPPPASRSSRFWLASRP